MNNNDKISNKNIHLHGFHAAIFDMDGVITQTAKVHNQAWKKMFGEFFKDEQLDQSPVTDKDYLKYIDGKPRYKGVQSFLESRGIDLAWGQKDDGPDKKTICGLGNKKNKMFLDLIEKQGVEVFDDTINQIKLWRKNGIKTAVISSSNNCKYILEKAGVLELFDKRVDGVVSDELKLNGKPDPDIFTTAANKLNEKPENCMVIEDAISGVQAGTKGNFALVIGIARSDENNDLAENGADIVVKSMSEINLEESETYQPYFQLEKPLLFTHTEAFKKQMGEKTPVLFLDYDGTLTPIVNNPADAKISGEMKKLITLVSKKYNVAAISGRDMDDLKQLMGIDELIYAGSHGFRISGPNGFYHEHEKTAKIVPYLDQLEERLKESFVNKFQGIQIERKRYAIAIHYRNAPDEVAEKVKQKTDEFIEQLTGVKKGSGKKIIELKPDIDWHKGKAVHWILEQLGWSDTSQYLPIYVGDDVTDEDAFEALKDRGLCLIVGHHENKTAADYKLKNIYQVKQFFELLLNQ